MSDGEEWKGESESEGRSFGIFGWGRPLTAEEKAVQEQELAQGRLHATLLTRFREDGRCPKCGHGKARTGFCRGGKGWACAPHAGDIEHLHRDCKRCSYTWYELPLDAETL